MAALNHVCMWDDTKGWIPITAEEAAKVYPYGASSNLKGFICSLCNHYVILTEGRVRAAYFKHNKGDDNKTCPERQVGNGTPNTYAPEKKTLPIKLEVMNRSFSFSIGFFPIPEMQISADARIYIRANSKNYRYDLADRYEEGRMNYLSVGSEVCRSYRVSVRNSAFDTSGFWPEIIAGIEDNNTLFDARTGKKLPRGADVELGKEYYVLHRYSISGNYPGVEKEKIVTAGIYKLTRVRANVFDKKTAEFFLVYFHARLTDKPVKVTPIWPVYIESPYIVHHQGEKMYISLLGNAEAKVFPWGYLNRVKSHNGEIVEVTCKRRQQFVSAGRCDMLRFLYLWKEEFAFKREIPEVVIRDCSGEVWKSGQYEKLPQHNQLSITAEVDGRVELWKKDALCDRIKIKAGEICVLKDIRRCYNIKIYFAQDLVEEISFLKKKINHTSDLFEEIKKCHGKSIEISPEIGAILKYLDADMQKWLQGCLRKGRMPFDAYQKLRKYIIEEKHYIK